MLDSYSRFKHILKLENLTIKQFLEVLTDLTGLERTRQWVVDAFKSNQKLPPAMADAINHLGYNVNWVVNGEGAMKTGGFDLLAPLLDLQKLQRYTAEMSLDDVKLFKEHLQKINVIVDSSLNVKNLLEG